MANEDLNAEIELLRKQLDALQKQRETVESPEEPTGPEPVEESRAPVDALEDILKDVDDGKLDLAGQVRGLLDSLDKDLRESKPSTLLIVFALGVLIGRLR